MSTPTPISARPSRVAAPPQSSRMTLTTITRGKVLAPPRVLLYGAEGIGKSTFAAGAPLPIFLPGEEGTNHLDVARFPRPETWQDVLESVRVLDQDAHDYKTFVVDTLDSLEPLVWAEVCRKGGKTAIEDFGFGKGYIAAVDEWRYFLAAVERLRARGMGVVLLAHSVVKTFKNPEGEDYDRYQLKLHEKSAGVLKEWSEAVLFAQLETYAPKEDRGKAKGISTGARIVRTQRTAAFDAKNRYDLPESMPLDWQAFGDGMVAHRPADPAALKVAIEAQLGALGADPVVEKVRETLVRVGDDAAELARIHNKLTALVGQKESR